MAITINEYFKTFWADLPKVGSSADGIPFLNLMEGSLKRKGFLSALYSQENMSKGMQLRDIFTESNGSSFRAIAKYKYQQRKIAADINTALPADYCTQVASPVYIDGQKEISQTVQHAVTILNNDLLDMAKTGQATFNEQITRELATAFDAFTYKYEDALITAYNTQRGINLTNGAATPVDAAVFRDNFLAINRAGTRVIENEFRKQEYIGGSVIAVGDTVAQDWYSGLVGNNAANNDGQIIGREIPSGMKLYDSQQLDSVLDRENVTNLNHLAAWKAGALQVLEAYEFDKFRFDSAETKDMTIMLNYGGLPIKVDMSMRYAKCAPGLFGWTINIVKRFDLWAFPKTNAFKVGDPLYQSNGTALFNLTVATP